jgi:putative transposase
MNLPVRVTVTAKVEAVTPKGDEGLLVEFLKLYRDSVQLVVNEIWNLNQIPSEKTLHKMFYSRLRSLGFRAHHVSEIYKRAREIVKSTKKNNGSKPVLKKLTARIHPLDYKIDLNTKTLRIAVLHDKWVELRLKWYNHLDKYLDGSWRLGEVLVSYRSNKILVYLTFIKHVALREPKTVMGVDINFNNVTYTIIDLDENLASMGVIPYRGLRRVLHLKKLAEKLQRRYPKSWRFMKWVRRARSRWLRRARNILVDSVHYVAKRIVEVAREYNALIIFEDLKKLRENGNGSKKLSWETQLWCYHRIRSYTEYKALVEGLRVIYVDPRKTSKTSPNGKPLRFINYRFVQLGETITSRDVVASWNLALRALQQMRGSWVTWSPDSPRSEAVKTRAKRGNPEAKKYLEVFTTIHK